MNRLDLLLNAWNSRSEPEESVLTNEVRERLAGLLLEIANANDTAEDQRMVPTTLAEQTTELVQMAATGSASVSAFLAELRLCQISLLDVLIRSGLENGREAGTARILADTVSDVEQFIDDSAQQLRVLRDSQGEQSNTGQGKSKSLQHEIRTPLQGALLTTELMLEDAQSGDAVQEDDISAVRRSIETAVRILNEFSSRSNSGSSDHH